MRVKDDDKLLKLLRTDRLLKWIVTNWKYWDETRMAVVKQHNSYDFHMYVAVDNKLVYAEINGWTENSLRNSLAEIENNRIFKIQKLLEDDAS